MHFQLTISLAGLIVGLVIGLTGMGGGALMTPILVILFNVNPTAAVSSDVIASLVLKPIGGGVHWRRGTVNLRLVKWLMIGSIPSAFAGAYLIDSVFGGSSAADRVKSLLGWVLLVAAGAIVAKGVLQRRRGTLPTGERLADHSVRPIPTLVIGVIGGLVVGLTSVGSGSLIIVMLMLLYPTLSSKEMVGTDLVQAIPLVASAALGHAIFGDPKIALISSVLLGAIPGVYIGAHISARGSDRFIRPVLVAVLAISSLKLLNVANSWLGVAIGVAVVAGLVVLAREQLRSRAARASAAARTPLEAELAPTG